MTSKTLVVFYDSNSAQAAPPPANAKARKIGADTVGYARSRWQFLDPAA